MHTTEIASIINGLIERKLKIRNEKANTYPLPTKLLEYMDAEITILERLDSLIVELLMSHKREIIRTNQKAFSQGKESGRLEAITGRPHPQHLFN